MHTFPTEMLPSLCRHCAKCHSNEQQSQHLQHHSDKSTECLDSIHSERSMWLLLATTTRKKSNKYRELLNKESGRSQSNAPNEIAMSPQNDLAYQINDQCLLQTKNISIVNPQSMLSDERIRNGVSNELQLADTRRMNGLSKIDVSTSSSNGALDGHPQSFNMQPMPSIKTNILRSSSSLSTTESRCSQCHCSSGQIHQTLTSTSPSHQPAGQQCCNFNVNVHIEQNPTSFSVRNDCVANADSDFKRCINKKIGIDSNGSSRSVRTVSANYSNNHPRKRAYVNHRWPYAISSTMNYSHVLLICIAFLVFSIRNTLVMADDTPSTSNNRTESK